MFLLARERERAALFGASSKFVAAVTDDDDDDDDDDKNAQYEENLFSRITRSYAELDDSLRSVFPELYIHSYDTNCLANGLVAHATSLFPSNERIDTDIAYKICVALVSIYTLSRGDTDTILFFISYFVAVRYPGQFLKSVLLLQGTSDSGKSLFVSEVLRYVYSSKLNGSLTNSTLKKGSQDEINTDLQSLTKAHVCQCDEPERMNPEQFKSIVSCTTLKGRRFHDQDPLGVASLAKLILTVNDSIQIKSDAGVITRLKYCLRMLHRYKTMHASDHDTNVDFLTNYSTPSVSFQFATRCFAEGVDWPACRVGLFLIIEHYGSHMSSYTDATFRLHDAVSTSMVESRKFDDADERIDELKRFHKLVLFGLLSEASNKLKELATGDSFADDEDDNDDDDEVFEETPARREKRPVAASVRSSVFSHLATRRLRHPIVIDNVPYIMARDTDNLHVSVDQYEMLTHRYRIAEDSTVSMRETDM